MKVLWVHNFNPNKLSSGVFIYAIIPELEKLGVSIDLFYAGNLRSPFNIVKSILYLKKKSKGYDIVHAQYGSVCAFVTSFIVKPKIVTIRGNDWAVHNETLSFLFFHTRIARLLTLISLNKFDNAIPVSNRLKNDLQKYFRKQIEFSMPSPIDLSVWKPHKKKYVNFSKYKVLFVGLNPNDPIKRFELANEVIDIVNSRIGQVELSVASDIPYSKMPQFVSQHHAILCLSETEGWPNSVKEALACNVPFVSTDVSDLNEIALIEHSCKVCSLDPIEIAESLIDTLQNYPFLNLRKYVEFMDVKVSSIKLYKVYLNLLKK
jgi:glycosyltransferase involved in cell wall biosynthesis